MTDLDWLTLNCIKEAGLESPDGKAAIARVVLNRMRKRFCSDGRIPATVLWRDQFSWAWFDFVTVHTGTEAHPESHQEYTRVAFTSDQARARAEKFMVETKRLVKTWTATAAIAQSVQNGTYSGHDYNQLTNDVVQYLNPRILTKQPDWAKPQRLVCRIGNHDFYRADDPPKIA